MSSGFYCPDPPRVGLYRLGADEARHLVRVCRLSRATTWKSLMAKGLQPRLRSWQIDRDHVDLVAEGEPIAEPASFLAHARHGDTQGRPAGLAGREGHRNRRRPPDSPGHRAFRGRSPRIQARAIADARSSRLASSPAKSSDGRCEPAIGWPRWWARSRAAARLIASAEMGCRQAAGPGSRRAAESSWPSDPRAASAPRRKSWPRPMAGTPSAWRPTYYGSRPPGLAGAAILLAQVRGARRR